MTAIGPWDGETRYRQLMRARMRSLFVAVEDLIEYTGDVLRPWRKKPGTTDYETALALLTARVRGSVAGVVVLAERGFGELGMAAARLAAEGMVAAHWMSLLPEERAERFLAFATFERLQLGDLLTKRGELREDEMPPEHRDPEKVEQLRKRFKDKSGWMQVPMKKVIEDVTPLWRTPDGKGEADFAQMVETLHLTGDRHSHVGAGDTLRFLAGDRIAFGPTDLAPAWGHQAMIMGGWSLLNTTDLAIRGLKLVPLPAWEEVSQRLAALFATVTKHQTVGVVDTDLCPCGRGGTFATCHKNYLSSE